MTIYPARNTGKVAFTETVGAADNIVETDGTTHYHYSQWAMTVDIDNFYINSSTSAETVALTRERNGAHEMGHILGLRDVDSYCNAASVKHHHELLMGYGDPPTNRTTNITYKDIAGVAIIRGFHTDDDHQWINCGKQSNGKYKWLCAICNGTKEAISTGSHSAYEGCGGNHALSGGKMMAVASYGTKDYYKCKYCRYVAPFERNVQQNYVVEYVGVNQHRYRNQVAGLNYSVYEFHNYIYRYVDKYTHTVSCVCTEAFTEPHWVKQSEISGNYGVCVGCGAIVDLRGGFIQIDPSKITQVSANGSYLLPSGIAVIVDADIEAYRNGTLVFYDVDDVPVTQ